jgi:ABC-type uncharacterized transport system ATPase subunit
MSIKINPSIDGPYTVAIGGSGGSGGTGLLSAINNGTTTIQGGTKIQGKMIHVEKTYSIDEIERLGLNTIPHAYHDRIKAELIELLMAKLIQNKCVEFTKQDIFMENSVKFRARVFVTPDDMIRILREHDL